MIGGPCILGECGLCSRLIFSGSTSGRSRRGAILRAVLICILLARPQTTGRRRDAGLSRRHRAGWVACGAIDHDARHRGDRARVTKAVSSISTTATSRAPSNSMPQNGCSTTRWEPRLRQHQRAGSNHHGKLGLSNKGILPLLWDRRFRTIPICCRPIFEDDARAAALGSSYARKPPLSREGANVTLVSSGVALDEQAGPYGAEGFVRQALCHRCRIFRASMPWSAAGW